VLVLVAGCGPRAADDGLEAPNVAAESGLVASLDIRIRGETAELGLLVANALDEPVELRFPTTQRYDFAIFRPDGTEVWRWSADQMFAQVVGTERMGAGGALEYRATWAAAVPPGRYIAEGRLVSENRPVELRTELEVPAR
jgi:hypothetical protein